MAKEQDQSMEEILQSIKRIIAEESEPAPSGSDVLELTELLSEDDASKLVDSGQDKAVGTMSIEEIMATPTEAPTAAPIEAPAPKPAPVAAPIEAASRVDDGSIVSDATIDRSAAAMDSLRRMPYSVPPIPSGTPNFRSGNTVEDLVLEALRPMLKSWLDEYLSGMVERLVEREVRRISGRP